MQIKETKFARRPRALRSGARAALISPSSPATREKIDAACDTLRSIGIEPVVFPSCFGSTPQRGYLAAESDDVKIRDIHKAFADDDIDCVICARGGSGAGRLIPHLDAKLIAAHPKIFAGYSDITILHSFIAKNCGFITFHSPMPTTDKIDDESSPTRASFVRALTDASPIGRIGGEMTKIVGGRARGRLVGGNMTVFTTTIGTAAQPKTRGRMIFLEDIDEPPYKIDRMLAHIISAGMLDGAAGLVFGHFTRCEPTESAPSRDVETVLREMTSKLDIPVAFGLDVGHAEPNLTIPLGAVAELDADGGSLSIIEPALK